MNGLNDILFIFNNKYLPHCFFFVPPHGYSVPRIETCTLAFIISGSVVLVRTTESGLFSDLRAVFVGAVDKFQTFCSVFVYFRYRADPSAGFCSASTASKHPANTQKSARPLTATRRFLSNIKHIISNPVQTKAARSFSPHMTKATVSSTSVRCEDMENQYAVFRQ